MKLSRWAYFLENFYPAKWVDDDQVASKTQQIHFWSHLFRIPRWFMSIEWVVWKFGWKTTQMLTIQHVFYWQINEFKFALAPRFTTSHFSAGALFVILKSALNNIYTRAQSHTFNEYRLSNNKFKLSRTILIQQQLCQIL